MPKITELTADTPAVLTDADLLPLVTGGATRSISRANLIGPARLVGPDWRPSPYIGPELWALANFQTGYNTTVLAPSLTANSTNRKLQTRVNTATNVGNGDLCYRFKCTVTASGLNGWYTADLRLTDASAVLFSGTQIQTLVNSSVPISTFDYVIEFKCPPGGTLFFELQLNLVSNSTTGTLSVTNCSLREVAHVTRPLYITESYLGSPGTPQVWSQQFAPDREDWRLLYNDIMPDGALTRALAGASAFNADRPWPSSGAPPDPTFTRANSTTTGALSSPQAVLQTGQVVHAHRSTNNDQILYVLKQDGVTYELRGNTHGGETLRSTASPDLVYEYDLIGDGTWVGIVEPFGKFLRPAHRFRWTWNTQIARSAPDSDVIANVNHVTTYFPDGMIRTDRTTSFTKSVTMSLIFEWMNSFDQNLPRLGRLGSGLRVLDEIDTYTKAAAPAITPSTATTGGTLAAATYMYQVTALTEGGESTPSTLVTQVTTGTTSTVTLSWSLVTGATGYRVYGRANAIDRLVLLATVGSTATSWTDDGSLPAFGQRPPVANTARRLDLPTTTVEDSATHANAQWAVWYDLSTGLCHATIWDRDAIAARAGIASSKARIEEGGGIAKTYLDIHFTGGAATITVTSSTVWTATHWLYSYCPANPANYHVEAALKAADLAALKAAYPAS